MTQELMLRMETGGVLVLPKLIEREEPKAAKRLLEFLTANIRNENTRKAYTRAVRDFLFWCDGLGVSLLAIEPMMVAAFIESMTRQREPQTVKQHLAAIRMLFDSLEVGQILPFNPAA